MVCVCVCVCVYKSCLMLLINTDYTTATATNFRAMGIFSLLPEQANKIEKTKKL